MKQAVDRAGGLIAARARVRQLIAAEERVRHLMTANSEITAFPLVLHRIVEAACELVEARYGALGVIGADGRLGEFLHFGMDDDTVEAIRDVPMGGGSSEL